MRNSIVAILLVLLALCPPTQGQEGASGIQDRPGKTDPFLDPTTALPERRMSSPWVLDDPNASVDDLNKSHEEVQKHRIKDYLRDYAFQILSDTAMGQKVRGLTDTFSDWCRLEFSKKYRATGPQWYLPGGKGDDKEKNRPEREYGMSFSTRLRLNTDDFLKDVVLKLNSSYLEHHADFSYEIIENKFRVDLFNTRLNNAFGADIHVEFSADENKFSNALIIKKPF